MTNSWVKRIYFLAIFLISVYIGSFLIFVIIQEVFRMLDRPGIGRQPFYIIFLVSLIISSVTAPYVIKRRRLKNSDPEPIE